MLRQIVNFLIHLRLHYQFLILSGGYLLAALFVTEPDWETFWIQFLNVHMLLFGGATAYNSWWDKDEGPIGGLKSPPKMQRWMWPVSMVMQYFGLLWGWWALGWNFALIYALSMLFFWLYSTPIARWKGKPVLSLVAIGVSTGTNSFFLGFLAAGGYPITFLEDVVAIGVALILLSLYPVSQIFQMEEDNARGDHTFALQFGLKGVRWWYTCSFLAGAGLISIGLHQQQPLTGWLFGGVSLLAYAGIGYVMWALRGEESAYPQVMRIKFLASFSFVLFIGATLLIRFFV
ncbi:UbiA family prenyltransferase [Gracilimonas mengyeensis]|uniref:1,4-dihydroxy-2-naphthoate octaprenyltransferase n=1 Tax=Gracilimonas mengyeensis TaxID=1302730 RepID=A0A521C1M9_9BACT|nr:UbiA family prenyltransferase [Gracilimonas mengyeensis]SMO53245.1 1,4-dihydroxy-2-naphthoate octaprenyltransferase [Gracilimonas mengyeensis]